MSKLHVTHFEGYVLTTMVVRIDTSDYAHHSRTSRARNAFLTRGLRAATACHMTESLIAELGSAITDGSQDGGRLSQDDSRVVSPSKTDSMNPLWIKGGDNLTFLTMSLNLKALRTHQRKGYGSQKESKDFKPTPPNFSKAGLRRRLALGK